MKTATTITVDYDCCGARYRIPTAIPPTGSALHHASAVDTITMLADAQHAAEHPECPKEKT